MSFTEKQKAYHLRKMQTRMSRLDATKDGYISRDDYTLISKRLAELSGMTKEQAESTCKDFMKLADAFGLQPGVKLSVDEAAQKANKLILSWPPEKFKAMVHATHGMLFDIIDTNKNGTVSQKEFKVYLNVVAPDVSEADVVHSFNTIDSNKNGVISRQEFLAAAEDFLGGVEETELSKVFFGRLLD